MIEAADHPDMELRTEVVGAIANLAMAVENKPAIIRTGCMPLLVKYARSGELCLELPACQALANISELLQVGGSCFLPLVTSTG